MSRRFGSGTLLIEAAVQASLRPDRRRTYGGTLARIALGPPRHRRMQLQLNQPLYQRLAAAAASAGTTRLGHVVQRACALTDSFTNFSIGNSEAVTDQHGFD